jgi:hypothetical protein
LEEQGGTVDIIFQSVNTIFDITAIFKYIPMLEKETNQENDVNDISYSSDMGSFSHYTVSLQYPIKVLDIIQHLVTPDSLPPSVPSTNAQPSANAVWSLCHCSIIWSSYFEFTTWQIPSLTHSVQK